LPDHPDATLAEWEILCPYIDRISVPVFPFLYRKIAETFIKVVFAAQLPAQTSL
jgi:hypothetical protein